MKKILQRFLQIAFLILFVFLIVKGKVQLWMGLFLAGVIVSFVFGRVYCGLICPINTVMNAVTWLKKKLHIKSMHIPKALKKPWIRYAVLGIFAALFIFIMISGKKLPVLPAMFLLGILLTLFFSEELWHRYLCPYGTILSLSSLKTKYTMKIDEENCISCGICKKVCPANAVEEKDGIYQIIKNECMICMECERKCKPNAISYKKH